MSSAVVPVPYFACFGFIAMDNRPQYSVTPPGVGNISSLKFDRDR
jgi:hypothetical protein